MALKFPSVEFFRELADRMNADRVTFEKLGYCDTHLGVRVGGPDGPLYALCFEVYECTGVREVAAADGRELDFILQAPLELWREMIEAIREHRGADAAHTLNTLSHLGDRILVVYDDPEGHDKFYRFMASLQAFFDGARDVEVEFV